jgi:hypothetical protein
MKQLTKAQKIYVLNEMIRYYDNIRPHRISFLNYFRGICNLYYNICEYDLYLNKSSNIMNYYFPELYNYRPKNKYYSGFWFLIGRRLPRLKYCKKILKIIEKS